MRATLGRAAVVVLLVFSASGCKSGPSMFAWGKKKQDNLSEAPKFASTGATAPAAAGAPTLPSSTVNPSSSLTNMAAPATAQTAYGATPAAYQNAYPKTPYEQAKLGGASAIPAYGSPTAPATSASNTMPNANLAGTSLTTAYGTNANQAVATVQPQNGLYQTPNYNAAPAQTNNPYAAASPPADPNAMMPAYRTADARSAAPGMTPGAADPNAMQANAGMGDRYATPPAAINGDRYANPAASAPAAGTTTGEYGDRYAQPPLNYRSDNAVPGNNGYQPGVTPNPPGNTGYSPSDVYSGASPAMGGAATLPVRPEPNYRPGGTSDYSVPAGATQPASSGIQPSGHVSFGGVTPASYQAPAAPTAASGEMYGAYQGASSASEPAYGASNSYSTTPGLLPAH